jgi:hypothetical protein
MADEESYVFLDRHEPELEAGAYTLRAELHVAVEGAEPEPPRAVQFWVGGERFSLGPGEVHSVYPAEGSRGRFDRTLPHIALRRDTLPWERSAGVSGPTVPWLALLVLGPEEAARHPLETRSLGEYRRSQGSPAPLEPGQADTDQVQVLELTAALHDAIPRRDELASLCHVRGKVALGQLTESVAVVVSKRLPKPGRNTVHLISLEGWFTSGMPDGPAHGWVVSLESWSFHDEASADGDLATLLGKLAKNASWLQIPRKDYPEAGAYLEKGRVPLPHRFRTGESGVSWYSGPLVPGGAVDAADLVKLPAGSVDELLSYHESVGMLDITYAAAWELGRLLSLERGDVMAALSTWRRQQVLDARRQRAETAPEVGSGRKDYRHLPQILRSSRQEAAPPEVLVSWVRGLVRLEGVPFKYLVPDERMLPPDAIRFFTVNPRWMGALLDGALSRARPDRSKKSSREQALIDAAGGVPVISGFIVRSAAVSGWPGLEVEAAGPVARCHSTQLSPSIRMCSCEGQLKKLTLRQHPGTLHLELPVGESTLVLGGPSSALADRLRAEAQTLELTISW